MGKIEQREVLTIKNEETEHQKSQVSAVKYCLENKPEYFVLSTHTEGLITQIKLLSTFNTGTGLQKHLTLCGC